MSLKTKLDSVDGLSDGVKEHYTEGDDGKFYLDLEGSFDHLDDVKRLVGSLANERESHKATRAKYKPFSSLGIDGEEIQGKLDLLEEYELNKDKAGNDEDSINKKVMAMVDIRSKKFDKEKSTLQETIDQLTGKVGSLTNKQLSRKMQDQVLDEAEGMLKPGARKALLGFAKNDLVYNEESDSFLADNDTLPVKDWVQKTLMENDYLVLPDGGASARGSKNKGKKTDYTVGGVVKDLFNKK